MKFRQRTQTVIVALALLGMILAGFGVMTHLSGSDAAAVPAAQTSGFYREATLATANVVTADEQSTGVTGWAAADLIGFMVTCVEDSGTATLDIALQRSVDGGTTWANIVAMTQLAATGAETKLYADVRASTAQLIGDRLRVNYDVTGSGQYTCSVYLTGEG